MDRHTGQRCNSCTDSRHPRLHRSAIGCADLYGADLYGADFRRTDVHGARFLRTDIHRTRFLCADVHRARLLYADIHRADTRCSNLCCARDSSSQ